MKISLSWLNDFVDVSDYLAKPEALAQLLTNKGLEVEGIEDLSKAFEHVVIGVILDKAQHPDAERLTVCQVSTGGGRVHQIVCGAKNHSKDDKVVVALPGAMLPGGIEIKTTKLRGVDSGGMLCSAKELGMAEDSGGLLLLPADAPVGEKFASYAGKSDVIFELKVTPNRADCLSHLGLAREISCLLKRDLKPLDTAIPESKKSTREFVKVRVEDAEGCPRYCARMVAGVKVGPSPQWLRNRLEVVGLRPINNVVDVTNYVMLELGQPLHAFDLKRLAGGEIIVARAAAGEKFKTLFEQELTLTAQDLTIRDGSRAVALAGVIGGMNSGIEESTQDVVIESALFNPQLVRKSSRKYNQQTDAAYRFARGVNGGLSDVAMNRACQLIAQVAGGEVLSQPWDVQAPQKEKPAIMITTQTVSDRLGFAVDAQDFEQWMQRLGCKVEREAQNPSAFRIEPLAFRTDLEIDMDLVEEYARLHGYEHIPDKIPVLDQQPSRDVPIYTSDKVIRKNLAHRGWYQAVNYGFISSQFQDDVISRTQSWKNWGLELFAEVVRLKNPLSETLDVMRVSLLPGLLQNVFHNYRQGNEVGQLFELGFVFGKSGNAYQELERLALISWGSQAQVWGVPQSQNQNMPNAFKVKVALEGLFRELNVPVRFVAVKDQGLVPEAFHPAQVVSVEGPGGEKFGLLGTVHPNLLDENKIRSDVAFAEINIEAVLKLQADSLRSYKVFERYPAVERDIAFVMPERFAAEELVEFLKTQGGESLAQVRVFDQFKGGNLPAGHRSLALRMNFRKSDGTFSESELSTAFDGLINAACQKFGISVR